MAARESDLRSCVQPRESKCPVGSFYPRQNGYRVSPSTAAPPAGSAPEGGKVVRHHAHDCADEIELMRAVAGGDPRAVTTLINDVFPVVYGFVLGRLSGDVAAAEDVMQETFIEIKNSARSFQGGSCVATWMCTIARRRVARHFARERRQADLAGRLDPSATCERADRPGNRHPAATHESPELVIDLRDEVLAAMRGLPVEHRHALVLKYVDGRSVEEVAAALDRTHIQTQSLLQRARTRLRKEIMRARS